MNADGRVRAYHGREEVRAQPAPSRHMPTFERSEQAFVRCNGWFAGIEASTPAPFTTLDRPYICASRFASPGRALSEKSALGSSRPGHTRRNKRLRIRHHVVAMPATDVARRPTPNKTRSDPSRRPHSPVGTRLNPRPSLPLRSEPKTDPPGPPSDNSPANVLVFSGDRPPERSEEGRSAAATPC